MKAELDGFASSAHDDAEGGEGLGEGYAAGDFEAELGEMGFDLGEVGRCPICPAPAHVAFAQVQRAQTLGLQGEPQSQAER